MTRIDAKVLCVGEVVWDLFEDGPVMGGAPCNTAVHLARHGLPVALLTAVGRDPLGDAILAFVKLEGIPGVRVHPSKPTGTVEVAVDALGVPLFSIRPDCAWTDLAGAVADQTRLTGLELLVFCGLGMHSAGNRALLPGLAPGAPRLCDLNLRPGWSDPEVARWCLEQADVLKVNADELAFLLALEHLDGPEALMERFSLRGLCTTLGAEGLSYRERQGRSWHLPVLPGAHVVDTVGAGDSVTAALAVGMLAKEAPETFLRRGQLWAARTCEVRGSLPPRGVML